MYTYVFEITPYFFITCIQLKLLFPTYLKGIYFIKFLFFGSISVQILKMLQKILTYNWMSCNFKFISAKPITIKRFFIFKYKLPKMFLLGLFTNISAVVAILPTICISFILILYKFHKFHYKVLLAIAFTNF